MRRAGKMLITQENGNENDASCEKLWQKQNIFGLKIFLTQNFFPDLSIDTNNGHIGGHIESDHSGQNGQNGHNGHYVMV